MKMNFFKRLFGFMGGSHVLVDLSKYEVIPREEFDRSYLDRFNALNCKEDLEKVHHYNAKQVTNIMAAWQTYKRQAKITKGHIQDSTFSVWAPNKRMATFLRHMTKWTVHETLPSQGDTPNIDLYFGINPSRSELLEFVELDYYTAHVIVGDIEKFISQGYSHSFGTSVFWDERILGPNKTIRYWV